MNDDELDSRLALIREHTLVPSADPALRELGSDAARQVTRPVRRRGHWGLGLGIAGALLALTAGTTATAYYLQIPPFQGIEDGAIRTTEPIPLSYRTDNGIEIGCLIYLDFSDSPASDIRAVDEAIRAEDWTDFGQDLYDSHPELPDAPPLAESLDPQEPIGDEAFDAAEDFAAGVIPGLGYLGDGVTDGPAIIAIGMTCRPDAQHVEPPA